MAPHVFHSTLMKALPLALALLVAPALSAQSIENVIVETYYISDANDATDVNAIGEVLAEGSRTYRVYLDLSPDCALRSIYGRADHPLSIQSTALIFNHLDRGRTYGHDLNNSALDEGTAALDSWLSFGAATTQKFAVEKTADTDGSVLGGVNSDGGSAGVPGGLLVNANAGAGIPLTDSDGLVPLNGGTAEPLNFNLAGDDPLPVFEDTTHATGFLSDSTRIGCSTPGVFGPTAENRILILQVTTTGELSFELNVEVECGGEVLSFVARDTLLAGGEVSNGLLRYPPECGCTDPYFLEYDPAAGCDDGSCATEIIFGCLDTLACNFDPAANFHVAQLCCYGPDDCNGLDVTLVCPDVGVNDDHAADSVFEVFPNPAHDLLSVRVEAGSLGRTRATVFDPSGRVALDVEAATVTAGGTFELDLSGLAKGFYVLRVRTERHLHSTSIIVN